jgi:putative protease
MGASDHDYTGENQVTAQNFLAYIESYDEKSGLCVIEQRNKFQQGDKVEILRAKGENFCQTIDHIYVENGAEIFSAPHPKQRLILKVDRLVSRFDMIRRA